METPREPSRSRPSEGDIAVPEAALAVLRPLSAIGGKRESSERRVGGKTTQLARWAREGFRVPPAWVLDARVFERAMELALPQDHDVATLVKLEGTRAGVDRAARAHERALVAPLPDDVRRAVAELWTAVEPHAPWGLAVRSSATCEDGERTSMAGLAETVLGVRGPEAIEAAIRRVWASLVLPRTLAYLRRAGVRGAAMPVLLQLLVRCEAAGVAFSRDPLIAAATADGADLATEEEKAIVVSATLGLGAPVVDGAVAADLVRMARGGAVLSSSIVPKPRALVVGASGLEEIAVPEERILGPALDERALRELEALVHALESRAGHPVDVEFAVDRDEAGASRVWLLQARAINVTSGLPEGGDTSTVWSRANVGEALPGAATPLTWSVARGFAEIGFREAFEALGCKVPKGVALVGSVHGRFYLNLTQFARIAAQVPGMTPATLLEASGGASPAIVALLSRQVAEVSTRRFLLRAPLIAPRLLARQHRLEREIAVFEPWAETQRRRVLDMDLGLLPDDALTTSLRATQKMLERTGSLMLVAASASLGAYVMLCETLARVVRRSSARGDADLGAPRDAAGRLAVALTGGVSQLDSAAPGVGLARVARLARGEPAAAEAILSGRARQLSDLPWGTTRAALLEFLESWGERAVREAELAVPRWNEDAGSLLAMLASSLRGPDAVDGDGAIARARALADREMARLETSSSRLEVALVKTLVTRVQHFTRLRERMRFWVTRVLGMVRRVALEADRRLLRIDPRLPKGAVFFCTFDELCAALASGRAEIGHVVRLRRAEHLRDAGRPDPPPTFVGRPPRLARRPGSSTRLEGLPASGGVVEGVVRVISSSEGALDALQAGEILVARTTDVGLTPLFLIAAGVVTELGGPLSHAAIVAREYGVPAVVDVEGATIALRNGDRVRVDGDRGVVELLDERPEGAPPAR